MVLFGKKKSAEIMASRETKPEAGKREKAGDMSEIKVLGSGCAKCQALEEAVSAALDELKIEARLEHVRDFAEIAAYGVMSTPALVVDGKLVSSGRVLKREEAKALIQKAMNGKREA